MRLSNSRIQKQKSAQCKCQSVASVPCFYLCAVLAVAVPRQAWFWRPAPPQKATMKCCCSSVQPLRPPIDMNNQSELIKVSSSNGHSAEDEIQRVCLEFLLSGLLLMAQDTLSSRKTTHKAHYVPIKESSTRRVKINSGRDESERPEHIFGAWTMSSCSLLKKIC